MANPMESFTSSLEYQEVAQALGLLDEEAAFEGIQKLVEKGKFKCGREAKVANRHRRGLSMRVVDTKELENWKKLFAEVPEERAEVQTGKEIKSHKKSFSRAFKRKLLTEFKSALHEGKFFFEIKDTQSKKRTALASKSVAKKLKEQHKEGLPNRYDTIRVIEEQDFEVLTKQCLKSIDTENSPPQISKEELAQAGQTAEVSTIATIPSIIVKTATSNKRVTSSATLVKKHTLDQELESVHDKLIEKGRKDAKETKERDATVISKEIKDVREDNDKAESRIQDQMGQSEASDPANSLPEELRSSSSGG